MASHDNALVWYAQFSCRCCNCYLARHELLPCLSCWSCTCGCSQKQQWQASRTPIGISAINKMDPTISRGIFGNWKRPLIIYTYSYSLLSLLGFQEGNKRDQQGQWAINIEDDKEPFAIPKGSTAETPRDPNAAKSCLGPAQVFHLYYLALHALIFEVAYDAYFDIRCQIRRRTRSALHVRFGVACQNSALCVLKIWRSTASV